MNIRALSQLLDVPFENNVTPTPTTATVCDTENNGFFETAVDEANRSITITSATPISQGTPEELANTMKEVVEIAKANDGDGETTTSSVKDVLVNSLQSFGGRDELADRLKKAIADAKEDKDPAMAIMFDAPAWLNSAESGAFGHDDKVFDNPKCNNSGFSGTFSVPINLYKAIRSSTEPAKANDPILEAHMSRMKLLSQIRKATEDEYHDKCPVVLVEDEHDDSLVYKYLEFDIMHRDDRWFEIFKSKLCAPRQLKDVFFVFADEDFADVYGVGFREPIVEIDPSPIMKELSREKTLNFVGFFVGYTPSEKDEKLSTKLHFEVMRQLGKSQTTAEAIEADFKNIWGNVKEAVQSTTKAIAVKTSKPKSSAAKRADAKKRNMAMFKKSMAFQLVNSFKPK